MNGREVFEKAVEMLGYDDNGLDNSAEIKRKMSTVINCVYADLYGYLSLCGCGGRLGFGDEYKAICDMNEDIGLDDIVMNDCFVYGVAMWLSLGENDSNNQRFYSNLYEYKRKCLFMDTKASQIIDRLPVGEVSL